jgi:hypothetical protein
MHHHNMASGVPLWVAIVVPVVSALLGLLGGGIVRFLLDRRAEIARAVGFARVVHEELQDAARRLEADNLLLLSTGAWEQYGSDLAGALLEQEFMLLSATYRYMSVLNARVQVLLAPVGAPPVAGTVDDEMKQERWIVTSLIAQGLSAIAWLARGDVPLWRRRRINVVLMPDPQIRCRCGHRWEHHRWQWRTRKLRARWRHYNARCVAYECNVEGCDCRWWRDPHARHLPRWIQRFGVGTQARPLGHDEHTEPTVDPSIPPTAQPDASVSKGDA